MSTLTETGVCEDCGRPACRHCGECPSCEHERNCTTCGQSGTVKPCESYRPDRSRYVCWCIECGHDRACHGREEYRNMTKENRLISSRLWFTADEH